MGPEVGGNKVLVPNRSISNKILVVQGALHSMNTLISCTGYKILKLNFKKDFDCIDLNFIR